MTYIDIHAHLDFKQFDKDRLELIKQMRKNKIVAYSNTLNPQNYEYTKELFKDYADVIKVCPGLYPIDAQKISYEEFDSYLKQIKKEKHNILAIGEIGLDRHHSTDSAEWEIQEIRFKKLIELGIKLNKPLIIHSRKAEERVLEIISEYVEKHNFRKFVIHCFNGKKKLINTIRQLNIYTSIPLTILNTQSFRMLTSELAISQILVETDSPFLNPNKTRNTPLNVIKIYDEIAKIKGYDKQEIVNIIYRNYMKLTN